MTRKVSGPGAKARTLWSNMGFSPLGPVNADLIAALQSKIEPGKAEPAGHGCSMAKGDNAAWLDFGRNPLGRPLEAPIAASFVAYVLRVHHAPLSLRWTPPEAVAAIKLALTGPNGDSVRAERTGPVDWSAHRNAWPACPSASVA